MIACARWCKTRSGMEVMGQFCSLVGGGEGVFPASMQGLLSIFLALFGKQMLFLILTF